MAHPFGSLLACLASCCSAARYAGEDPEVFGWLLEHGGPAKTALSCDALAGLSPSQVRGRVAAALGGQAARRDPLWDPEIDA